MGGWDYVDCVGARKYSPGAVSEDLGHCAHTHPCGSRSGHVRARSERGIVRQHSVESALSLGGAPHHYETAGPGQGRAADAYHTQTNN